MASVTFDKATRLYPGSERPAVDKLDLEIADDHVAITATVRTADRTGVEMEALTAVTVAALAVVDMVKGVDRSAAITDCRIVAKSGGRSGDWERPPGQ